MTHLDASKPAITWAKENQRLNAPPSDSIRWILDDALAFVQREVRRRATYDGIILDPPAFGHAPSGKIWKFHQDVPRLLEYCLQLLSPKAGFLILNSYATNMSSVGLYNLALDVLKGRTGKVEWGELCLKQENQQVQGDTNTSQDRLLSTGCFVRYTSR